MKMPNSARYFVTAALLLGGSCLTSAQIISESRKATGRLAADNSPEHIESQPTTSVQVCEYGTDEWDSYAEISAGGKTNAAHYASVRVGSSRPFAAVDVSLNDGVGHSVGAALSIGGQVIHSGETAKIYTDGDGICNGTLLSSDVLWDDAVISTIDSSAVVAFAWSNYDSADAWSGSPDYLVIDGSMTETVKLKHDGQNLDGHVLYFYVDYVIVEDDYGNPTTIDFDPDDPGALNQYALFSSPEHTVTDGQASAAVTVQDKPELVYIHMCFYDEAVWLQ